METNARPTILIVEDEPFVQMLLSDYFGELGYAALSAGDARSALILLETRTISLLLADVGLPGLSGRALAEAARKLRPSLPVLFVTGYSDQHKQLSGNLAQGTAVVAKPFDMERLAEIVRALIGTRDIDRAGAAS
jgi:DNA-binding response OmpR family regulator